MIDVKKYMDAFASEAEELLQTMNTSLLAMERTACSDKELINQVFRCAHSLKGMSATMGFPKTAELAHSMESLLDGFRRGEATPSPEKFSILFECADALEKSIKSVSAGGTEPDTSELAARVEAETTKGDNTAPKGGETAKKQAETKEEPVKKQAGQGEPAATREETEQGEREQAKAAEPEKKQDQKEAGTRTFTVSISLKESCQMKPLKLDLVRSRLAKMGKITKDEKKSESRAEYTLLTEEAAERIRGEAEAVAEVEKAEVKEQARQQEPKKKPEQEQTSHIKVPVKRLDKLVNLAGELITAGIRIRQLIPENNPPLGEATSALERLSLEIQNETMLARMVPADEVFGKFPRMVRDLAKEEGKEIRLVIEGGDIELDRSVLDRIGEPLMHLLRNAADHGIEAPEERVRKGKPPEGTIRLSARREKNTIIVEVSDDGTGLDTEEIKRTALERKVAEKSEIDAMEEKDIPWLMFRSGFSTSKKVTEISGRGVGLHIAKATTESMGGAIEVESEKGKGCKFSLTLPLSLAIVHSLIVGAGSETYAIPMSCVQYVHRMQESEVRMIGRGKAIILEGAAVPVIGLRDVLKCQGNPGEEGTVLIVKKGRERTGITVDRVMGEQEIMVKPLEHAAAGFSGASILPDGRVVLVPDIYGLI